MNMILNIIAIFRWSLFKYALSHLLLLLFILFGQKHTADLNILDLYVSIFPNQIIGLIDLISDILLLFFSASGLYDN